MQNCKQEGVRNWRWQRVGLGASAVTRGGGVGMDTCTAVGGICLKGPEHQGAAPTGRSHAQQAGNTLCGGSNIAGTEVGFRAAVGTV